MGSVHDKRPHKIWGGYFGPRSQDLIRPAMRRVCMELGQMKIASAGLDFISGLSIPVSLVVYSRHVSPSPSQNKPALPDLLYANLDRFSHPQQR